MSDNDAVSVKGSQPTKDSEDQQTTQANLPPTQANPEPDQIPSEPKGELSMEDLLQQMDDDLLNIDLPKAGEIRDGIIASISEGQILVSVCAKSEGIITGKEY